MKTHPSLSPFPLALSALVALALSACGGGGSDAPAAGAATPLTPAAPVATPVPPATTSGSTCGISDFANAALARMNALRAAGANCGTKGSFPPAAALTWSAPLTQSSEAHSRDMVTNNFFSHTGSNGSTLSMRVDATGYLWSTLGENIAAGYSGLDAVMAGWMASDGHCANLMNATFREVGLVCVPGTSTTTYNTYWTMDLGLSR